MIKGVYVLLIEVNQESMLEIGALGKIQFKSGHYMYVGSAQGGVESRIRRHFRSEKKFHWHVDYLLAGNGIRILNALYKEGPKQEECLLADKVAKFGEPIPKFGSSDCKCNSHLFFLTKDGIIEELKRSGFKEFKNAINQQQD
ncbi:MAG: GIY-YIG nuclease family protein [Candidatus Helarchaeales archaeon]